MAAKVRIADVAAEAHVSRTTASYLLSGQEHGIPRATQDRVWQAARRLGFRPNRLAQRLAGQRSGLVGLVVPDISSPFFSALVAQVQHGVRRREAHLLPEIAPSPYGDWLWQAAVDRLLGWQVDGLLLWSWSAAAAGGETAELLAAATDVPLVLLGQESLNVADMAAAYVDFAAGTTELVRHLLAMGHRRLAFVGYRSPATDERAAAYGDVRARTTAELAAAAGGQAELVAVNGPEEARAWAARACRDATAIVCLNDPLALAVWRGLRDAGLAVPHDVSLVSCDGSWAGGQDRKSVV